MSVSELEQKKSNFANYLEELNKKLNNIEVTSKVARIRSVDLGTFLVGMNEVKPLLCRPHHEVCKEFCIDLSILTSEEVNKVIRYCRLFCGI